MVSSGVSDALVPRLSASQVMLAFTPSPPWGEGWGEGLSPQTARTNSRIRTAASSSNQSSSVMGTMPEADVARVGIDQAGLVEAVAAHHAADGVGDQPLAVFFAVGAG